VAVVSPCLSVDAIGIAALTYQAHAIAGVRGTEISVAIVGRAGDDNDARAGIPTAAADLEIGAATAINPYSAAAISPGRTVNAGRIAALSNEGDAAARIGGAMLATAVVGRAVEGIGAAAGIVTGPTGSKISCEKIGAAAAVNPNVAAIITPCGAEDAGSIAALIDELNSAARIGSAEDALAAIGVARNCSGLRRSSHNAARGGENEQGENDDGECQ
jgi:hypothetical protein